MAYVGQRFRTGEVCNTSGDYAFDGYTDGTSSPAPTADERNIPMTSGHVFPPVRSSNKGAYWKFTRAR